MQVLKTLLLTFLVSGLWGCQATRETLNLDTTAEINLYADQSINPDRDKRASPLVVRIFKLADDRQFSREDFLNLYEDADNRLGKDLLDTIVLKELAPGEQRLETIQLSPEVAYLGILAEFVQFQDADAVTLVAITPHKTNSIDLQISGLTIQPGKPGKQRTR